MDEDQKKVPEILLKLSPNGVYSWTIRVCGAEVDTPAETMVAKLKEVNNKLVDTFPNHAMVKASTKFHEWKDDD